MTRGKGEPSGKARRQERWRICWEGRGLQRDQKAGRVITLSQGDRKPLEAVSQGMKLSPGPVSQVADAAWTERAGGPGRTLKLTWTSEGLGLR